MEWTKPSPEMGKILEKAIAAFSCQKKTMFGAPVYMNNGNMFTGVHGNNIFLRLSEIDRAKIVSEYKDTVPFEPVKGHVMKEYVTLPKSLYTDDKVFQKWLKRSYQYAQTLKPKESKSPRKKP